MYGYIFKRKENKRKKIVEYWKLRKKAIFTNIAELMFGFGDCEHPFKSSAIAIENLAFIYVNNLTISFSHISTIRLSRRPKISDLIYLIRNQPSKKEKVEYLVRMKLVIEETMGPGKDKLAVYKKMG